MKPKTRMTMETAKTKDQPKVLVSIVAKGVAAPPFEEIWERCNNISIVRPDGRWVARAFEIVECVRRCFDQTYLPGPAILKLRSFGEVSFEHLIKHRSEVQTFAKSFYDAVLVPLTDYWTQEVDELGLPAGQDEKSILCESFAYINFYFLCCIEKVAGSYLGQKVINKHGMEAIKRWYVKRVGEFVKNDVRVNLGSAELATAMEIRFNQLVEEKWEVISASDVE